MAQSAASAADTTVQPIKLSVSHVGIFVHDMPKMEEFYTRVLGFKVTDRGKIGDTDIVFTSWDPRDHHQVALVGGRPAALSFNPINQISFRVGSVEDIQSMWNCIRNAAGVHDIKPVNHGVAWSLYFRDPEGNRLEIFCDGPWYVEQPRIEHLDLSLPADEIRSRSDAYCRSVPGAKPIAEYQAELKAKMMS